MDAISFKALYILKSCLIHFVKLFVDSIRTSSSLSTNEGEIQEIKKNGEDNSIYGVNKGIKELDL